MWNIMLDEKPDQWNGYPIHTDFRIGIQIIQLFQDQGLDNQEKFFQACELLFPGVMPETMEEIQEALEWFLNGWYLDGAPGKTGRNKVTDYDIDQWRIYSAFRSQYQIDLNTASLHWWEYMGLLTNLEECAYTRVIGIRQKKIVAKMPKEEKKAVMEAKKIYSLRSPEKKTAEADEAARKKAVEMFHKRISDG